MSLAGTRERRALVWPVLFFLGLWAFGTAGWHIAAPDLDWFEATYRGLQMFSLNFTEPPGNVVPWQLQVARFAQPAFTIAAFAATVSAQLRLIFRTVIAWRAEQVTIIGYGVFGKAAAERFRSTSPDMRLVALDRNVTPADHRAARLNGVELIECDALDAEARRSYAVGIARSRDLVIACGTDQANLSLLDELSSELSNVGHRVRLWLHLSSHTLAERLRESYSSARPEAPTVEFVEAADHAAQSIALIHPLVLEARTAGLKRVHAIIHGFDDFGWLAAEQVLLNGIFSAPDFTPPRVSVIVADAPIAEARWRARHPDMQHLLDVRFHTPDGGAIAWTDATDPMLGDIEALMPSIHIFAGTEADSEPALIAALSLRDGMRRGARPVAPVVVLTNQRQLTGRDLATSSGVMQLRLTIIDGYDTPMSAFGLIGRTLEEHARAFHASYAGMSDSTAFDRLPHTQRLSNRRAAYHMMEKLRLLGFEDADPRSSGYGLSEDGFAVLRQLDDGLLREFDLLEHLRWRVDRYIEGWRAGPRNSERRLRDRLGDDWADYHALSVAERGKDRSQFETFVATAVPASPGQAIVRIADVYWEGVPPCWSMSDPPTLVIDEAGVRRALAAVTESTPRLCLMVPRLPPSDLSADAEVAVLRDALAALGERLLTLQEGIRVRFLRPSSHPWDWLPPDERGLIDGVTLSGFAVGCICRNGSGPPDVSIEMKEALRAELVSLVPPGTRLITGLATSADRLMIELWSELSLGPITGIVPYWHEGPALGPEPDDVVPDALRRICEAIELPSVLAPDTDDAGRHDAIRATILWRTTMLYVLSDKLGGAEDIVDQHIEQARARRMLLRCVNPGRY